MIRNLKAGLLAASLALVLTCLATGQAPPASNPVPPKAPAGPAAPVADAPPAIEGGVPAGKLTDPTRPSPNMKDALSRQINPKSAAPAPGVSPMALRGRVIAADKPAAALLEIDGRIYTVSKGSVLAGANKTTIRVLDVTASEVRLEVSPTKEIVILR